MQFWRPARRVRTARILALSALSLSLSCLLAPAAVSARGAPVEVAVIGDSIATELGHGMQAIFAGDSHVRVIKQSKFSTGLVRTDYYDWNAAAGAFLRRHRPDVIVIALGGNDRQDIARGRQQPLARFSPAWRRAYARRVDRFMGIVARAHARIYWVGLPIVESRKMSRDYRVLNAIYRREAARHHVEYVAVWDAFANKNGAYTSFGPWRHGARERLRKHDGMHFTERGARRLADYVARAIKLR